MENKTARKNKKSQKRFKYNRKDSERQQKLKIKNKSKLDKEKTKNGKNSFEGISEALQQKIQAKAHRIQRCDKKKRLF